MDRMEIEYTLTADDLIAFQTYAAEQPPTGQRRGFSLLIFGAFFVLMACVIVPSVIGRMLNGPVSVGDIMALVLIVLALGMSILLLNVRVCIRAINRYFLRQALRRPEGARALQPQRLCLSPEGVTNVNAARISTTHWKAVRRIGVTPDHVMLMTGQLSGFVVPRRAFRDENEFQNFVELARRYQTAAASEDDVAS